MDPPGAIHWHSLPLRSPLYCSSDNIGLVNYAAFHGQFHEFHARYVLPLHFDYRLRALIFQRERLH